MKQDETKEKELIEEVKEEQVEDKVDEVEAGVPTEEDKVEDKTEIKEEQKPNKIEVLRELSKELGVNLFEVEGLQSLKDLKASQDKLIEEITQEIETIKRREEQAQIEAENARLETLRIRYNLDVDKFEDFLILTKARISDTTTVEEAFNKTLEKYGETFISKRPREEIQLGLQVDNTNPVKKNAETFDQQVLDSYLRRRK